MKTFISNGINCGALVWPPDPAEEKPPIPRVAFLVKPEHPG